jgi:hypothetical protein
MRRAAQAAADGLTDCIQGSKPGIGEWQLAAAFGEGECAGDGEVPVLLCACVLLLSRFPSFSRCF